MVKKGVLYFFAFISVVFLIGNISASVQARDVHFDKVHGANFSRFSIGPMTAELEVNNKENTQFLSMYLKMVGENGFTSYVDYADTQTDYDCTASGYFSEDIDELLGEDTFVLTGSIFCNDEEGLKDSLTGTILIKIKVDSSCEQDYWMHNCEVMQEFPYAYESSRVRIRFIETNYEQRISALESWKQSIDLTIQTIQNSITNILASITSLTARVVALEDNPPAPEPECTNLDVWENRWCEGDVVYTKVCRNGFWEDIDYADCSIGERQCIDGECDPIAAIIENITVFSRTDDSDYSEGWIAAPVPGETELESWVQYYTIKYPASYYETKGYESIDLPHGRKAYYQGTSRIDVVGDPIDSSLSYVHLYSKKSGADLTPNSIEPYASEGNEVYLYEL